MRTRYRILLLILILLVVYAVDAISFWLTLQEIDLECEAATIHIHKIPKGEDCELLDE